MMQGIPRQTINSSGGVKRFFIVDFSAVKATIIDGEASFVMADGTVIDGSNMPFKAYQVTKRSSNITNTYTGDPVTGQGIEQQIATLIFHKQEKAKRSELDEMKNLELIVIGEDFNDEMVALGCGQGGDITSIAATTGTAGIDLNGYTVTITANEKEICPVVADAFKTLLLNI